MFGEGQGNEGSDKCSERAEDSWMQRVEGNRERGMRRGEERTRGMDALARPARVIERDEFHSPDRFRREDATRAVSGAGIRGIPGFEKATECRSESRRIPQRRVCRIRQAIESRGFGTYTAWRSRKR